MPKAIRLREDNLDFILEYGREREMDLRSTVDNFYYNAADGFETMLVTDGTPENRNVTFTDMTEEGFHQSWKFAEQENPNMFVKIERV
jgi:hypothetical protein